MGPVVREFQKMNIYGHGLSQSGSGRQAIRSSSIKERTLGEDGGSTDTRRAQRAIGEILIEKRHRARGAEIVADQEGSESRDAVRQRACGSSRANLRVGRSISQSTITALTRFQISCGDAHRRTRSCRCQRRRVPAPRAISAFRPTR
jgi:hypothetical protein